MRGFMLRALSVCLVAVAMGCFSTSGETGSSTAPAGTPKSATHAYWQGAAAALAQKPLSDSMKSLVDLVSNQATALRALSPEGVDPQLVEAVEEVIRCEEEVVRIADLFGSDESKLKTNKAMALTFADANTKASEAKKRLRALRGPLNDRCGGGFAPLN